MTVKNKPNTHFSGKNQIVYQVKQNVSVITENYLYLIQWYLFTF